MSSTCWHIVHVDSADTVRETYRTGSYPTAVVAWSNGDDPQLTVRVETDFKHAQGKPIKYRLGADIISTWGEDLERQTIMLDTTKEECFRTITHFINQSYTHLADKVTVRKTEISSVSPLEYTVALKIRGRIVHSNRTLFVWFLENATSTGGSDTSSSVHFLADADSDSPALSLSLSAPSTSSGTASQESLLPVSHTGSARFANCSGGLAAHLPLPVSSIRVESPSTLGGSGASRYGGSSRGSFITAPSQMGSARSDGSAVSSQRESFTTAISAVPVVASPRGLSVSPGRLLASKSSDSANSAAPVSPIVFRNDSQSEWSTDSLIPEDAYLGP